MAFGGKPYNGVYQNGTLFVAGSADANTNLYLEGPVTTEGNTSDFKGTLKYADKASGEVIASGSLDCTRQQYRKNP